MAQLSCKQGYLQITAQELFRIPFLNEPYLGSSPGSGSGLGSGSGSGSGGSGAINNEDRPKKSSTPEGVNAFIINRFNMMYYKDRSILHYNQLLL